MPDTMQSQKYFFLIILMSLTIPLNYHISATFHTISKANLQNFAQSFVNKILTLSYF